MELWDALGLDIGRHRMVTLVGGGGKTTAIYALAHEARQAGKTVLVTTTTHMMPHPGLFLTGETEPEPLRALLRKYGMITAGVLSREDKMTGVGNLAACKAAAEVVLVEGDGARLRPLKAPADYEPVLPPETDGVVAVAGMDCLGRPIGEVCHRPERVCALLGEGPERLVTPAHVARILASSQGGRKNVPSGVAFCCLLNKADSPRRKEQAEEIAARLALEGIRAAVTSFTEEERGGLCWF